jgi:hypothetical protein
MNIPILGSNAEEASDGRKSDEESRVTKKKSSDHRINSYIRGRKSEFSWRVILPDVRKA